MLCQVKKSFAFTLYTTEIPTEIIGNIHRFLLSNPLGKLMCRNNEIAHQLLIVK